MFLARLTEATKEKLKALANKHQCSMNEAINKLINGEIEGLKTDEEVKEAKDTPKDILTGFDAMDVRLYGTAIGKSGNWFYYDGYIWQTMKSANGAQWKARRMAYVQPDHYELFIAQVWQQKCDDSQIMDIYHKVMNSIKDIVTAVGVELAKLPHQFKDRFRHYFRDEYHYNIGNCTQDLITDLLDLLKRQPVTT